MFANWVRMYYELKGAWITMKVCIYLSKQKYLERDDVRRVKALSDAWEIVHNAPYRDKV